MIDGGARRLIHGLAKLMHSSAWACRFVFTRWEFSNTAKLSVFKSVFVPILTYGQQSWVMTERILCQVQAAKMGFLWRVHRGDTGAYQGEIAPGARNNLAAPCLNLRPFGSKRTVLKKKRATFLGLFGPLGVSTLVALCLPCPPR